MFQWSRDETLKIVAKMIAHPHDLTSHQILKCAAKLFFSWQSGTGCSQSFQKHLRSSRLNLGLEANRHYKLILVVSVTVSPALGFSQNLSFTSLCYIVFLLHRTTVGAIFCNVFYKSACQKFLKKIFYVTIFKGTSLQICLFTPWCAVYLFTLPINL